ncbi:MAG TPA: CaiB/BaiF CoA-transferase family protein [Candidatus Deferrimicrobium sp.]|nr:CaiB/BaiF CoA-transferase family protein [Candidatus Deferrimicrobium sp.]
MPLALDHIRILDLTTLLPGPFATSILADFGAEVIKIEPPKRPDLMRNLPPLVGDPKSKNRLGAVFHSLNRNKKSLTLNLKKQEGQMIFKNLVKTADVLIEQFRPGVMKKLGIAYETLKEINQSLIYCSITGYGQDGPYRDRAGHDINYIGVSGMGSLTGLDEPILQGVQVADIGAGSMNAVVGILIALIAREKTFAGQYIDISMMEGTIPWLQIPLLSYLASGEKQYRGNIQVGGGVASYNYYKCKDGKYLTIGALEPQFYTNLCKALNRRDLNRYYMNLEKQEYVKKELAQIFITKNRDDWLKELGDKDVCIAPLNEIWDVEEDPQVKFRKIIINMVTSQGIIKQLAPSIRLNETSASIRTAAPQLGEHNEEILKNLGYSPQQIDSFRKQKVI